MDSEQQALDPRQREAHPERVVIGDEEFIRNDIQAKELGCSERSVDRGDKLGAPYLFIGGVKYRPARGYAEFMLSRIQVRQPQPDSRSQKKARLGRSQPSAAPAPRRRAARPRAGAEPAR